MPKTYNNKTGHYYPINPNKCVNTGVIAFKSDLERLFMIYLDKNPDVVKWGYEVLTLQYIDESTPEKEVRRYFLDFVVVLYDRINKCHVTKWVEVKSSNEAHKPIEGNKRMKTKLRENATWIKNQCKWKTASIIAKQKGAEFIVITEEQLKPHKN